MTKKPLAIPLPNSTITKNSRISHQIVTRYEGIQLHSSSLRLFHAILRSIRKTEIG